MTNKAKKTEPVEAIAPAVDIVAATNSAYEAGYDAARRTILNILLQPTDNMGGALAEAMYFAGCDKDGVFWLSVACRDRGTPTHQLNNISKLFRNNRKLSISAIAPYRVSNIR